MTCGQQLIAEIRKLAGHGGPGAKTVSISAPDGVELSIDVTAADSMSCSCRELRHARARGSQRRGRTCSRSGPRRAVRSGSLTCMEQLGPLEADVAGQTSFDPLEIAQTSATTRRRFMKSCSQSQGAGLFTLRRYRRDTQSGAREPVDLRTTHEVLEKLADDLIATIPSHTN